MGAIQPTPFTLDPLVVNSVKVQDTTRFLPNGGTQDVTIVTYWLGRHGPFTLTYPRGAADAVTVNNDITAKKQNLAQIMGVHPTH